MWLVWRAIREQPRTFIVASASLMFMLRWGFARMRHPLVGSVKNRNGVKIYLKMCVKGGQGIPARSGAKIGSAMTLGSTMKSRADGPAPTGSLVSKISLWIALSSLLAVLNLGPVLLHAESASGYFKHGQAAEAAGDYDAAYTNYQRAYSMSPTDVRYRAAYFRVRLTDSTLHVTKGRNLMEAGDEQGALVELLRAIEIHPSNEAAQEEIDSIGSPAQLKPMSNEPLTLHMVEDSKVVYQAVGKASGINVLFDPYYISKRIQVDLNNVSLLDALRIVGTMSGTFWRPITPNTIFVAANTRSKRAELDEQAVQTFYLTNAWQQNDLNDVQTALRNVLPSAKV